MSIMDDIKEAEYEAGYDNAIKEVIELLKLSRKKDVSIYDIIMKLTDRG